MNIEQIKNILDLLDGNQLKSSAPSECPVEIGKAYLFRTVTHIELGEVVSVCGNFVTLKTASWVADTGRYHDCFKNGTVSEVEPYPNGTTVNMAALINFAPWDHPLPTEQK